MQQFVRLILLGVILAGGISAFAQNTLTNGWPQEGAISAVAEKDTWSIAAKPGDRIRVQIAKTSGGASFSPKIEIFAPDGFQLGMASDGVAARLDIQAQLTGDYSVVVSDRNQVGTGAYQLQLAQIPGTFLVPADDEGGMITNGARHAGSIPVGDFDLWTISAKPDDYIVLQVAKTSGGAGFTPRIELFGPDGTRVDYGTGNTAARVEAKVVNEGLYTVLISDLLPNGSGGYELYAAQAPGSFTVPESDEGGAISAAVDQEGAISVGDLDLWSIDAIAGENITVQVSELTGGAGFTPQLELFTPNGKRFGPVQGASSAVITAAIETSGTYTVLVSDAFQAGPGTYRLRWSRDSRPPPTSPLLTNGGTYEGTIESVGDEDIWSFTASAGESIIVRVGEKEQGSSLSPMVRLTSPNGVLLDSGNGAAAAEVVARATNSGTFTITVRDNSSGQRGTGDYRLSLVKTGSPLTISASDEGGSLTNGATHLASIETGDVDAWSFTANAGESVIVRMGETTSGSTLTPELRLYDPSGVLLSSYYSSAVASEVTVRATNSGTFLVVASDRSNGWAGTGNYRLSLVKTGSPLMISASDEGGSLTNGTTHLASIETGDVDAWTFTANAGESLIVRMGETISGSTLTPELRLYDPSGVLLDSYFSSAVASEVSVRATNSGTFLVVADDRSNGWAGTGNYRLCLVKTGSPLAISASDEGGALTNGATHLASIETGDVDAWTFTANAGESIIVRMGETTAGTTLTPELRLYDPSGALLSFYYSSAVASEVTVRATNSGTFLVVADDRSNGWAGTGNYRLCLVKTGSPLVISAADEGGSLTNGATSIASLETGDLDGWTFNASAGESIIVRMGETTPGSSLTPELRLYDPSGVLLDSYNSSAAASEVTARATNNGVFLVVASDRSSGWAGIGNYRLSLTKSPGIFTLSEGDEGGSLTGINTMEGSIEVGELDQWTFSACAGDDIFVQIDEINTTSLTPLIRLFGHDGTQLNRVSGQTTAQVSRTAPANGTYTIVIGDLSSAFAGSGTYRLTVNGLTDGLKFCVPTMMRTNLTLTAFGGPANAALVLYATSKAITPWEQWTPFLTNQFDRWGVFNVTNAYDQNIGERYFRLTVP